MTVTPRLGPALLREIPRFFGGFGATLQELLQNALRAGATEIDFTLDGLTLTVTDNGCGLADPQVLLTAAESGWGAEVVEPAGLGALSVLNPEFAAAVTYRSRGWRFTLTPDDFAQGHPVPVEGAPPIAGFQVTVTLRRARTLPEVQRDLVARRGYAPVTVRLNGDPLPPLTPSGTRLETPAGPLYLESSTSGREPRAIWEHFPLGAGALKARLQAVGSPVVQALLDQASFTLQLDPACGVRPKLPDRNALLDDEALLRAAQGVAHVLHRYVEEQLRAAIPALGADVLRETDLRATGLASHGGLLSAFLQAEGYVPTTLSRPQTVEAYIGEDSDDDTQQGWTDDWIKTSLGVTSAADTSTQALLALLRGQGLAVPYGTPDHPEEAEWRAEGLTVFRRLSPWDRRPLAVLAERLTLGAQTVPVAVHAQPSQGDSGPICLVLGGTPEEAEAYLRAHQADVGGLLLLALLDAGDLRECDLAGEDDITVTAADLGDALLASFISAFFSQRAQAQEEVERLGASAGRLRAARHALETVGQAETALAADLQDTLGLLEREEAQRRARREVLIQEHRLA
ncbi:ATP-binding protein [Deinococcus multiflagellatus]|nr:ATP-binding protein [Deinococcus multiflagellatus]MBZ9715814.1 ATP-binding protein [Deinococcus multiflagellatus]